MIQGRKVWFGNGKKKKNVAQERAKRRRRILRKAGSIQDREESEHPQMSLTILSGMVWMRVEVAGGVSREHREKDWRGLTMGGPRRNKEGGKKVRMGEMIGT